MEKKHDLLFCPDCGTKLDGDEIICSVCGYHLAALHPVQKVQEPVVSPPPPVIEAPVVPPAPTIVENSNLSFCPTCGVKLDGNDLFCNVCGARLSDPVEVTPVVVQVAPPPPPPPVVEVPIVPPPPVVEETVVPPPPPVVEVPVVPPPPIVEETVVPPPPPVVEEPIVPPIPPPVVETTVVPPETPVIPTPLVAPVVDENKVAFCPNCGSKISTDEAFCNECGFNLNEPVVNNPVIETPVVPLPYQTAQPEYFQQAPLAPAKKKGMGIGLWVMIIFIIVIVIGGGTLALLQYNGTVNIGFLSNVIPSKDSQSATNATLDPTRYYVVTSFATIGSRSVAIISGVVASRDPFNSDDGAKNKFKIAIMKKFPEDYSSFINNILVSHYSTLPEAVSAHSGNLKSYGSDKRGYEIRTVDFTY